MAYLFDRVKKLSKNNIASDYADITREEYTLFYLNYFRDMCINFFEWKNLPEGVDREFVETALFDTGYAALIFSDELGFMIIDGSFGSSLNIYNRNMTFKPNPKAAITHPVFESEYHSVYDFYDVTDPEKDAIILGNNYRFTGYHAQILLFARKLADIEMTIDINRRAQLTPYILKTTPKNYLTVKNLFNQISSYKPVINVKEEDFENVEVMNLNAPLILDRLHDEKNRIISQCLNFIGLNSNAIDKAERLVRAEANANNAEIQSNIEIGLRARRKFCELANKIHGLDIQVDVSRRIDSFNDGQFDFDMGDAPSESGESDE